MIARFANTVLNIKINNRRGTVIISNFTPENSTNTLMDDTLNINSSYKVYQIKNNDNTDNCRGTFTIEVSDLGENSTKTIYYILVGGGGGGGLGKLGGGGGGGGQISHGKIELGNGNHLCRFKIGKGGNGSNLRTDSGYGTGGSDTKISFDNGTTYYTAKGGGPGGPSGIDNESYTNNFWTCGGGAGTNSTPGSILSGGRGTNFNGGNSSAFHTHGQVSGGGGGASFYEAGEAGAGGREIANGGKGGRAFRSSNFTEEPFKLFSPELFFSEGGCGSAIMIRTSITNANTVDYGKTSTNSFGGKGAGYKKDNGQLSSQNCCSNASVRSNGGWGSGGGGAYKEVGTYITGTDQEQAPAGSGSQGNLILFYSN